jgi:hypothetical protein
MQSTPSTWEEFPANSAFCRSLHLNHYTEHPACQARPFFWTSSLCSGYQPAFREGFVTISLPDYFHSE